MLGLDTETVNRPGRGESCLITLSTGDFLEFPSSFDQIFRFLRKTHHGTTQYMAYNMDFDARALLHEKFIRYEILETLAVLTRAEMPGGYRLDYVPGKFVRMSRGRDAVEIYDLAQFFGLSLKRAAEKFLPDAPGKDEIPKEWLSRMDDCLKDGRRDRVIKYALQDAALVPRLFELVRSQFETLGVIPRRWLSAGSLAVKYFENDLKRLPSIPIFWQEAFRKSYFGGRIEVGGLGKIPARGVNFYDINSAYPWAASILPGLDGATPVHRMGDAWAWNPGTIYGSYHVLAEIPENWVWGPLALRDGAKNDPLLFPVGKIKTWCGLAGLKMLRRLNIRHTVLESFEFYRMGESRPAFPTIPGLYAVRKNPALNIAAKLTLNSLYGKMAQDVKKFSPARALDPKKLWHGFQQIKSRDYFGPFTCFPIAAAITEMARLRIFEIFHQFQDKAYAAMTDGILISGEIPTGKELGQWGLKMRDIRGILFGCGRYYLEGLDGDGVKFDDFKFRGFSTSRENLDILRRAKGKKAVVYDFRAPSLVEYTRGGGVGELNVLKNVPLLFDLKDEKRYFPKRPQKIAGLFRRWFKSVPWIFRQNGGKNGRHRRNQKTNP